MAGGSPGCVVCGKPRGPFTVSLSMKLKNKPRAIGFERAARSGAQAADADRRRAAGRTCPRSGRSSKCAGKQSRARRAAGGDRRAPCPRSATVGRPSWVATPSRASGGMMPPVRLSGTRQVVLHNRIFEPVHKGNSLKSLANNGDSLSKPSTPYIDDESPPRLSHNYWAYRLAGRDGHTQPSISACFLHCDGIASAALTRWPRSRPGLCRLPRFKELQRRTAAHAAILCAFALSSMTARSVKSPVSRLQRRARATAPPYPRRGS
jgi:hypothetical protein